MRYLLDDHYVVVRLADAVGNSPGTEAPMLFFGDKQLRAPDLLATKLGTVRYWEVKYRDHAESDRESGRPEFWVELDAFTDYLDISRGGTEVWIALYEADSGEGPHWHRASVQRLAAEGRAAARMGVDGEVAAWVWPRDAMGPVIDGPPLHLEAHDTAVGPGRSRAEGVPPDVGIDRTEALGDLCEHLGLPGAPRYSVLRVGIDGSELDEVLDLLRFGIRVFLITDSSPDFGTRAPWIAACQEARLFEWAVVPDLRGQVGWFVDGQGLSTGETSTALEDLLRDADTSGGFNLGQYRVVHAEADRDILVTAGAGTGKTETMSERLVFLLATCNRGESPEPLRMDEIAMLTFSREAAAEMRRRVAKTLTLRTRLCDMCVLPALTWLAQLNSCTIGTIHTYAKEVLKAEGAAIGLTADFKVRSQTMAFRRLLSQSLSDELQALIRTHGAPDDVPAAHEFSRFIREVWEALAQNGLSPFTLTGAAHRTPVDWGPIPADARRGDIARAVGRVITDLASRFSALCLREQTVPVEELVAGAIAAVKGSGALRNRPRYLFVDEFQDTDAEQMDFLLLLRGMGTRIFVVGDPKQGVYRFRGAQGDAFKELAAKAGAGSLDEYGLTRNFRSGARLLDSLHPVFEAWGDPKRDYLAYAATSRLRPAGHSADPSKPFELARVASPDSEIVETVDRVSRWVASRSDETVGILCRTNAHAISFADALRREDIPCELWVGRDFYRTEAVRETRAFLQAVLAPQDDAAVLELCETRWLPGLMVATSAVVENGDGSSTDYGALEILSWAERLSTLTDAKSFYRGDLEGVRRRLTTLAEHLDVLPPLAWLADCVSRFRPTACSKPSDNPVDLPRYKRCLDHLLSLMDAAFSDSPVSAHRLLQWLTVQIASNRSEDEPPPAVDGPARVTALTVHKSKGLEFDRVILPRTGEPFRNAKIAVVSGGAGPTLLWRWTPAGGGELRNFPRRDPLWRRERSEAVKEEARLLYVAMTRARSELVILRSGASDLDSPDSWGELL